MFARIGRAFTFTAILLLNVVIATTVAEWAAGVALKHLRAQRPVYMLSYSDAEIRALYNSDQPERYRQVIAESWRMGDTVYSPFVEFRMSPHAGQAFTITEDGYRPNRLSDQDLKRPGRKVFVFGGSTTMGSGVRDDETIPAGIERALRAAGRDDVQVFNFGVVSYFSTQELIALQRLLTAGVKPDVAVFVDGLNDFYYCTVPDQSSWYDRLVQLTRARARMPLGVELANRSNVVQLARALGGDKAVVTREWGSYCKGDDDVRKVVNRLDTNRRMVSALGKQLGFQTILVQQPVPTYAYDNSKRPVPVKDEMLGYHVNAKAGYPLMAAMRDQGALWTQDLLWLAELEPAQANAYVDTVHYSPAFNDLIGARVAQEILRRGLPR